MNLATIDIQHPVLTNYTDGALVSDWVAELRDLEDRHDPLSEGLTADLLAAGVQLYDVSYVDGKSAGYARVREQVTAAMSHGTFAPLVLHVRSVAGFPCAHTGGLRVDFMDREIRLFHGKVGDLRALFYYKSSAGKSGRSQLLLMPPSGI